MYQICCTLDEISNITPGHWFSPAFHFCYFFYFYQSKIISSVSADTMSTQSLNTLTRCQRSRWLNGHTFLQILYLRKNEKVHETVFAYRAQVESFKQKKLSWHCPFNWFVKFLLAKLFCCVSYVSMWVFALTRFKKSLETVPFGWYTIQRIQSKQ